MFLPYLSDRKGHVNPPLPEHNAPTERSYYTDSIDFSRKKDAELYLNRFALINIDEFDQVSSTQQGFLKHILQKPVLNVKKPHGSAVLEMRRYASFIATSNQKTC